MHTRDADAHVHLHTCTCLQLFTHTDEATCERRLGIILSARPHGRPSQAAVLAGSELCRLDPTGFFLLLLPSLLCLRDYSVEAFRVGLGLRGE